MKVFNAQDGQGLSLAHTMGIQTGFITGRRSPAVAQRARELKVAFVYLGQAKKTQAFEECLQKAGVTEDEVAYMGDDLPDIPLAQRAGLAVCVADGVPELKAVCHYTTTTACRSRHCPRSHRADSQVSGPLGRGCAAGTGVGDRQRPKLQGMTAARCDKT